MRTTRWVQVGTILLALHVARVAAAQDASSEPEPAVGTEGRWVFDLVGAQFALGRSSVGGIGGYVGPLLISSTKTESLVRPFTPAGTGAPVSLTSSSTVIALTPSMDTFVTERFSVGGRLTAGFISSSHDEGAPGLDTNGYMLGAAPRVGYVFPLSSSIAFWPRLGVGYEVSRQGTPSSDGRSISRAYFVESNLGIGIRISKHALFDLGPVLTYRRSHDEASPDLVALGHASDVKSEMFAASVRAGLRLDF